MGQIVSLAWVVGAGGCRPTYPGLIPHGGIPTVRDGKFSVGWSTRLEWSSTAQFQFLIGHVSDEVQDGSSALMPSHMT
jgi:hypothetical protein